jgi:hypothetical protein
MISPLIFSARATSRSMSFRVMSGRPERQDEQEDAPKPVEDGGPHASCDERDDDASNGDGRGVEDAGECEADPVGP